MGDVEVHKAVTLVEVTHWESADDGVVREVEFLLLLWYTFLIIESMVEIKYTC